MQNMNEIRHHIHAVQQTRKITNAMYMVSSARMKKVTTAVAYNRAYLGHVQSAMQHILASVDSPDHVYIRSRSIPGATYIVIAGDKGMAGAYNADVLKLALQAYRAGDDNHLVTVGILTSQFFRRLGIEPDVEIIGASQDPSLYNARHLAQDVFRIYDERLTGRVYVVYTEFFNSVKHAPIIRQLLPVEPGDLSPLLASYKTNMLYHPSPEEMFHLLVPQYAVGLLYGALLHAYASEHSARMNAMQNATHNADDLLEKLRASYHMARQNAITQEIIEITGSARAQKIGGAYEQGI